MRPGFSGVLVALWLALALPAYCQTATPGGGALSARWQSSPAIAGQANTVVLTSADGTALTAMSASIVSDTGDEPIALTAAADGAWSGPYTPAKPGAYALRVVATAAGEAIDLRLPLEDVRAVALNLPAIQSGASDGRQPETPAGPSWATIVGFGLAALLLIAAVWLGRRER